MAPVDPTRVLLVHNAFEFEQGVPLESNGEVATQSVGNLEIDDNGKTTLTFVKTNLSVPDVTSAIGEEVFTVTALAGQDISETILDSQRVQVFPIAQAEVSGYDPTTEYEDVPPISVELKDLYPSSKTYVRIYPGTPVADPSESAEKVSDSIVIIEDAVAHDRTLVLSDLDSEFVKHGVHTIEVVHETPFGEDLLFQNTIQVDRKLDVNGSLYTN